MTTEYTLGLAFAHTSDGLPVVLLIQKGEGRPHAGCWNGLGGKLHPGEQLAHGMNREFREESGIDVAPADWLYFGILEGIGWRVHLFAHQMAPEKSLDLGLYAHRKHAGSKEPIAWICVRDVMGERIKVTPDLPVLLFLATRALHCASRNEPVLYARMSHFALDAAKGAE